MRSLTLIAALVLVTFLPGCPEKNTPAEPETVNAAPPASAQTPAPNDTAGAPKPEDDEDEDEEGGW
jgi:hypothetical protein